MYMHVCRRLCNVQLIFQASCRGEVNECHNGGTMIWNPVKSFECLCKEWYVGEFCEIEKGNNVLYLSDM